MNCEHAVDASLAQLTGDLDAEAQRELQAHLAECPACAAATEGLRALWTSLATMPSERPSAALRARFYAMLEAYRHQLAQPAPAPRRGLHLGESFNGWLERWWPRQPVFQFALALVFLGAGLVVGPRLRNSHAEMEQLKAEIQSTRQLMVVSMLQQTSPGERLQGVSYSSQLQQPNSEVLRTLLETLDTDPNVNVRIAVAEALGQFRDVPQVRRGLLESMSRQTSPLVQVALIDVLVQAHEREAAGMMQQLTQNPRLNPIVRQRAQWGLQQLQF